MTSNFILILLDFFIQLDGCFTNGNFHLFVIIDDQSDTASILRQDVQTMSKPLTDSELTLIKTMVIRQPDTLQTGRFLTMHKRRRKKLTTRSLSTDRAPALLDDVHHGLVQVSHKLASQRSLPKLSIYDDTYVFL